MKGTVHFETTP